jgi:hypothetical protein
MFSKYYLIGVVLAGPGVELFGGEHLSVQMELGHGRVISILWDISKVGGAYSAYWK